MGKGKLVAGIILLIIGGSLIPTSIAMGNIINRRIDESIPDSFISVSEVFLPIGTSLVLNEATPEVLLAMREAILPVLPNLVNRSVATKAISSVINDLTNSIGLIAARDWFFNDPSFTTNTSGKYLIQGISEYAGVGNLSFTETGTRLILNRLRSSVTGSGITSFLNQLANTPQEIGGFFDGGEANGISVSGSIVYIADGNDGLEIINITDPTNPIQIGQFDDGGYARDVFISGSLAFVADDTDGLEIINITDPTNPTEIGNFFDGGEANKVVVTGSIAYLADGTDGLEIVNVTNPSSPTQIGQFFDGGEAKGVRVSGIIAYLADGSDGIEIINITDPTNPTQMDQFDDGGEANDVFLQTYLYVADGTDGLEIIDVSSPTNIQEINDFNTSGDAQAITVSGIYAYLADKNGGIKIFNIQNPLTLSHIGTLHDGGWATDIQKLGTSVYVADGTDGLEIINASNPVGQFNIMRDMSATMDQIWNVSVYITDYLTPLVPTLAGFLYAVNSTNAVYFFYMQWANETFIPGTLSQEYNDDIILRYWEANVPGLNMTTTEALWDSSNEYALVNDTGIQKWIHGVSDNVIKEEITTTFGISNQTFDGIMTYLQGRNFREDLIGPIYEDLQGISIINLAGDKFYQQWATGILIPEGLGSFDPLYTGFELTLPPENSGLDLATSRLLWTPTYIYSFRNPVGLQDWLTLSRNYVVGSDEYNTLADAFGFNETQMNLLTDWLLHFRNMSTYIVLEDEPFDIHPYEMVTLVKTGTNIAGGLIGFIGLIFLVSSFKKSR